MDVFLRPSGLLSYFSRQRLQATNINRPSGEKYRRDEAGTVSSRLDRLSVNALNVHRVDGAWENEIAVGHHSDEAPELHDEET